MSSIFFGSEMNIRQTAIRGENTRNQLRVDFNLVFNIESKDMTIHVQCDHRFALHISRTNYYVIQNFIKIYKKYICKIYEVLFELKYFS